MTKVNFEGELHKGPFDGVQIQSYGTNKKNNKTYFKKSVQKWARTGTRDTLCFHLFIYLFSFIYTLKGNVTVLLTLTLVKTNDVKNHIFTLVTPK